MVTSAQQLLADAQTRIADLLRASPAADLERNLKALLAQTFQKLELVTREEFEVERERLARLQMRLEALERHLQGGAKPAGAAAAPAPAASYPGASTPSASNPSVSNSGADAPSEPPANPYQLPPTGGR